MASEVVLWLGFESAVPANVSHANATAGQHAADQETAVTVLRVLFAAEQRHPILPNSTLKPVDAVKKRVRLRDTRVEDMAIVVVKFLAAWPTSQFLSSEDIAHGMLG
jgi:hypothetical protein